MDHVSDTIYSAFPVKETNLKEIEGSNVIIWTTTPWTIPANKALAYNSSLIYLVVKINDEGDFKNKKIIVAKDLLKSLIK